MQANGERLVSQRTTQPVKNKSRFALFWTWHPSTQRYCQATICPCFTPTLPQLFFCAKLSVKWFCVKHINHQNLSINDLSQRTKERILDGRSKQKNTSLFFYNTCRGHTHTHLSFSAKSFCNFCSFSRAMFSAWFFRVCSYSRIFSLSAFIVTSTEKQ